MNHLIEADSRAGPWHKGTLVGQKAPLHLKDVWAIRIRLRYFRRIAESELPQSLLGNVAGRLIEGCRVMRRGAVAGD